jgi:hypothetical protein
MQATDLRAGPPRRWNEKVAGIYWLPRLIDKARACVGGTLGDYLYGQSPMDRGLLRQLHLSHSALAEIVKTAFDDGAVVSAIEARDSTALDRARAWSERLPSEHRLFFWFIDLDDGYRRGGWYVAPVRVMANGISRTAKRIWPRDYRAAR